jgi:hypothetical protein
VEDVKNPDPATIQKVVGAHVCDWVSQIVYTRLQVLDGAYEDADVVDADVVDSNAIRLLRAVLNVALRYGVSASACKHRYVPIEVKPHVGIIRMLALRGYPLTAMQLESLIRSKNEAAVLAFLAANPRLFDLNDFKVDPRDVSESVMTRINELRAQRRGDSLTALAPVARTGGVRRLHVHGIL